MGLDKKVTSTTPRTTPTREDLEKMVKDIVGDAAERIMEKRDRDLRTLDDPNALREQRRIKTDIFRRDGSAKGNVRRSRFDKLAEKPIEEMNTHERALMFARSLQCLYQANQRHGGIELAYDIAEAAGQKTLCESFERAFQATDFDQGGFMIEPAFADAVIEELVAKLIYTRAGPTPVDLPQGGLVIPYENDGADASWVAEGAAVNAEEITGGQLRLQPHKLITIVGVSNDMLRARPGTADSFVLASIQRGMGVKLDSTLLRGVGASNEPMGLRGLVASGNQFDVTSVTTLTMAVLIRELLQLQNLIETQNVDLENERAAYFGAPRTKNFLKAQRATDGLLFPGLEKKGGDLLGVPAFWSTNIPINLDESGTAADDESELYCVAVEHMILGRTEDMIVDVQPGAAYTNSSGSTVAAFSRDETPIRVISEWDHGAGQRGNEIAMAQELDWALV